MSSKEAAEATTNESEKESTKVLERVLARAFGNELANQSAKELRKSSIRALGNMIMRFTHHASAVESMCIEDTRPGNDRKTAISVS